MNKEVKERMESWLAASRDLLQKVMSQRDKVQSTFHDEGLSTSQLQDVCHEVENSLDETKEILKRLYLILYETRDLLKTEGDVRTQGQPQLGKPQRGEASQLPAVAVSPESAEVDQPYPAQKYEIPDKCGGLLEYLGQWHWFVGLPKGKRDGVVAIMCSDGRMTPDDLLSREVKTLRPQFATYCWKIVNKLMKGGYDEVATSLLIKGLTVVTEKRDKEMLHIMYAKYFYRQRNVLKNAYDACINHCEKAIRSYMQDREERPKPVAPFKLLITIYEERDELDSIAEVCDKAISLYQRSPDQSKVVGFLRIRDLLKKKETRPGGGKKFEQPKEGKLKPEGKR
jgi:hypothetical protein